MTAEAPEAVKKRTLSIDEIHELLTEIALSGDGADRFRALKLLQAEKQQDAVLPKPLTTEEVLARLERLMRAAGARLARLAFMRFRSIDEQSLEKELRHATPEELEIDVNRLPTTLKQFNKRYPEAAKKGTPPGYPQGGSPIKKEDWVRQQAFKIELERRQRQMIATQFEVLATDGDNHDGAAQEAPLHAADRDPQAPSP